MEWGEETVGVDIGETGSGKEIVAEALHELGSRAKSRLVKINCAAVPETLLESELFGYEKGAFSGAAGTKPGLFEEADVRVVAATHRDLKSASAEGTYRQD